MDKNIFLFILILISLYFLFFRTREDLTNCNSGSFNVASNPLTEKMSQLLLNNKLSTRSISRIVNFDSRDFEEDTTLTLKQLFDNDKIPQTLQNSLMKDLNELINSYRLEDITKDYVIDFETTVATVKHIFLKNMVINTLLCFPNKPDDISLFWGHLVDMLITPAGVKCNDEDFLKFLYYKTKTVEKFFGNMGGDELDFNFGGATSLVKDGITLEDKEASKEIDFNFYKELDRIKLNPEEEGEYIISFNKHFLNFGPEMLGGKFKIELDNLFDIFAKDNNRSINHESEEDMKRLMDIYEKEFKNLVDLIKKSNNDPRLEQKFKNMKEIYQHLKFNLILGRVQKELKSKKASERAFRCLSTNNKTCVPDINKIFGNEDIGFVSQSTCVDRDVNKFQDSSLDSIFKIHKFWADTSSEDKKEFFDKLRIMLDYHNKKVPENFGVVKLNEIKLNMDNQASLWKGEKFKQTENNIFKTLKEIPSIIEKRMKDENLQDLLINIVGKMNYSQRLVWNQMLRKPNFKLSSNLIKYFIFGLELENLFKINTVEMFMHFGLPTSKSFNDIMIEYNIPIKYIPYLWKSLGKYIPQFVTNDITSSVNSVFYDDEFFVKNSYYVSYLASICYNKDDVIKRMETNLGENISIEDFDKIKSFITQQCKNNK